MIAADLSVSVSTDNRLLSGVDLSSELQAVHSQSGVTITQLGRMMGDAARASFMPAAAREAALQVLDAWPGGAS
jgi:adenosine deaminase